MWFGEPQPFPERGSPTGLSTSGQQSYEGWAFRRAIGICHASYVDRLLARSGWNSSECQNLYMHSYIVNLLKPTGHVMHHQFNIQQLYVLRHCIYVFCIYLRTNSDLCHLQHKLIGFYNRDEECLQRGTDWGFK